LLVRALLLASPVAVGACAALSNDMARVDTAFSEARYEDVRVWLRELEPSVSEMSRKLRTRYYYMAGVTAARLGDAPEARHYLVLCREEAALEGFGLSEEQQRNLALTLRELRESSLPELRD